MSPTLNRSLAIWYFELSNAIKLHVCMWVGGVENEVHIWCMEIFCNLQEWRHNHKQSQLSPDQAAPKQVCSLKCVMMSSVQPHT